MPFDSVSVKRVRREFSLRTGPAHRIEILVARDDDQTPGRRIIGHFDLAVAGTGLSLTIGVMNAGAHPTVPFSYDLVSIGVKHLNQPVGR